MYLDPGFGGMLLQVILAIVAVGGAILYSLRRKIRNSLIKKKDVESDRQTKALTTIASTNDTDVIDVLKEKNKG